MKHLAFALVLVAGPALAQDPPHAPTPGDVAAPPSAPSAKPPEPPKPILTAEEGKRLYEYGLKVGVAQGMARVAVEAAQQDARPVLEKLQSPASPKP